MNFKAKLHAQELVLLKLSDAIDNKRSEVSSLKADIAQLKDEGRQLRKNAAFHGEGRHPDRLCSGEACMEGHAPLKDTMFPQ